MKIDKIIQIPNFSAINFDSVNEKKTNLVTEK